MTAPTLARLEAALTPEQRAALAAVREAYPTAPDPAQEELNAAVGIVELYTTGRSVAAATLQGWAIDIAAYKTATRLGEAVMVENTTNPQKDLHDQAMRALREIAGGELDDQAPSSTSPAPVAFGGRTNIFS